MNNNIFKNLIFFIFSLQEKFLRMRLENTLNAKSTSLKKRRKMHGCFLDFSSLEEERKNKFENEINTILKNCDYNPSRILEYISENGTKVYYNKNAKKMLTLIGECFGFIYPQKGLTASIISIITENKISFSTKELFILENNNINTYYMIYYLYNWYAFKNNISGMDSESQELLKKFMFSDDGIEKLQLNDIYKLKDAIKQDKAALEFVIKLCRNSEGARSALEKLKSEDGTRI